MITGLFIIGSFAVTVLMAFSLIEFMAWAQEQTDKDHFRETFRDKLRRDFATFKGLLKNLW